MSLTPMVRFGCASTEYKLVTKLLLGIRLCPSPTAPQHQFRTQPPVWAINSQIPGALLVRIDCVIIAERNAFPKRTI